MRIRNLVLKHPTFARTSGRTWGTRLRHPLGNVETFRLSPGFVPVPLSPGSVPRFPRFVETFRLSPGLSSVTMWMSTGELRRAGRRNAEIAESEFETLC